MHVVQRPIRRSQQRRMYSPSERGRVSNVGVGYVGGRYVYTGLGEVDGLFNIPKMFKRMFKFTPRSFKLKNIVGAIGSATMFTATGGFAALAPKILSAKSDVAKIVGGATLAVAAIAGGAALLPAGALSIGGGSAGALTTGGIGTASSGSSVIGAATGQVAASGGFWGTVGSGLSTVGSGLMTGVKALTSILPVIGAIGGGGGGAQQQQQQGGMTQAEFDAQQQAAAQEGARQQAEYDRQVAAQQAQMYFPGMVQDTSYMGPQTVGQPGTMQTSYGDLRTPYTAITEDGQQVQVDPTTGQVIQPGMSTEMMIGIAAAVLIGGVYFMSGSKTSN